ncbi:hypothetical protein P1J78_22520 [Psychromarinibacter sp. C21-152]|uniref:Uncharacterized protein n=1 Tax=Psychromarinibacter sediminicola TaxID=3033385 RepID=A0AAE3NZ26_9RHOB|nr:hypothetical protein [Psychromarinibacter sediminicola]MDF0603510.1 hypothetical protein [Psychromarinibacter sediminicola]
MTMTQPTLTYLPLRRRAGLVRAFAKLVRALPDAPAPRDRPPRHGVPDGLRRDVGLPPAEPGRGAMWPPPERFGRGLL